MKRKLISALVLTTACAAPVTRAPLPSGIEAGDLDRAMDPCNDFYEFANGTWRTENPIPAGVPRWGRRPAAREANRRQVANLLTELALPAARPAGSPEQQVGDLYASCMDQASADRIGLTPLAPLLGEIDALHDLAGVQRVIRRLHELAIPAPFGIVGAVDNQDPRRFLASVVAGGLGLPSRDHYLGAEPRFEEARARYRLHVARVLALGGMPEAEARQGAEVVFALEKRLATATLDSAAAADPAATEHRMTFAQLEALAPHVGWGAYFDEAHLPRVELNVAEPRFLQQVESELAETPVAVWRTYLRWQLLESAAPWLTTAFVLEAQDFEGGATAPTTRAQRCLELTETLLGEQVGRKYAERAFPPEAKARVQEMIQSLRAVLKEDVAGLAWMTPAAKETALAKLARYDVQVGYPDRWKDTSGLIIQRGTLWADVAAARRFQVDDARRQMGKPTGHGLWQLPPSSPDAYIDLQLGEMVLPAGFLQPPLFRLDASDAVNYGAIGAGIAHDMTHTIDAGGAELDLDGRPRSWWTDADRAAFASRGQCVADQFEGYFVAPGVHHQGKLVLSEAIGDLTGLRLAYLALERSRARHPAPAAGGFTPEQQFFLSYAQYRGDAMRPEAQREYVKADPHPVPRFRVIGPLSNLPEFQQAFACPAGSPMVRPPEQRCWVW